MSIIILLFAILLLLFSLLILFWLNKFYKIDIKTVQYQCIDGLRGYLAFFVFLHHCYFYYYSHKNNLEHPYASNAMNQIGDTSVILFFMITGFLFTSKLLNEKEIKTDWIHFYTARILRIFPVFIILVSAQLMVIFYLSDFTFFQKPLLIIKEIILWLSFSIIDYLPINAFQDSQLMIGKVLWTIPYEIFFYLCIPLLSLFISKHKSSFILITFNLFISIFIAYKINANWYYILPFLIGIIVAFLLKNEFIAMRLNKTFYSFILLMSYFTATIFIQSSFFTLILLSVSFICVAGGNSLFGILNSKISQLFGQISYSMYLLHGLILYILFNIHIGKEQMNELSNLKYGITLFECSTLLIFISMITYKYIERPLIMKKTRIAEKIKTIFPKIR